MARFQIGHVVPKGLTEQDHRPKALIRNALTAPVVHGLPMHREVLADLGCPYAFDGWCVRMWFLAHDAELRGPRLVGKVYNYFLRDALAKPKK
ncbi:MAG: hypothetical protein ABW128_06900 [Rhizorhabdus sp.]